MPNLDEQLSRALREAAPRPTTSGLDQRLARRRRARAVRRRLGTGALAVVVLAGTAAAFLVLSDAFEGDQPPLDPPPTIVPGPKANGPLVVVVPDGDQTSHLAIDRLDGSVPERLTEPGQELAVDPAASPDGRRVAFVAIGGQGRPAPLVVLDVETGEREIVAQDAFADPSWSPDGRSIVYEGLLGEDAGLVVVDLASNERRFLATGADPSWSPDGSTIAFEVPSDRPPTRVEQQGIFTIPATGGEPTHILDSGTSPSWSPDGSSIAFTRVGGVWIAGVDGGGETLLIGQAEPSLADPSWAPDGSLVMFTSSFGRRSWIDSMGPGDPFVTRLAWDGTDAAWLPLADVEPTPTETPTPSDAETIAGVPFAVCRVTTVSGNFGPGLDTAWVFEEEHTPGWGCDRSEGFQHLAVGADGRVEMMTRRLTDVLNDDAWRVWAFAAPDLNDDGIDEIAIARQGGEPRARHLWLFTVADGEVVPITDDGVPWNLSIGPILHENGVVTESGLTCEDLGGRAEGPLMYWQPDTEDPLHLYLTTWILDGSVLVPTDDSELLIDGVAPAAYPPSGLDELCGSPTNRSVDFPHYLDQGNVPATETTDLCNVPSMTGDVDGDGSTDLVSIGSVIGPAGCPTDGQRNRVLTIDLYRGAEPDVVSRDIDCSIWCFPFAAVDLSGDGTAEILVNEGHTALPASAVIAVYELVPSASTEPYLETYLEPVRFPDGSNRFPLVNSGHGWHGAYCSGPDAFTTWEIPGTGVGGVVPSVTYREYTLSGSLLRFELRNETTVVAPDAEFPSRAQRGYDGVFCGVEVEEPG